jgi:hypothetical protein
MSPLASGTAGSVVLADVSRAAGPLGLLIVLLLGVATVLLIRNMDKRVKRLPREFPDPTRRERDTDAS